jgi:hypothetical protein
MVALVRTDPEIARIASVTVGCWSASNSSRPLTAFNSWASCSNVFEGMRVTFLPSAKRGELQMGGLSTGDLNEEKYRLSNKGYSMQNMRGGLFVKNHIEQ